MIRSKAGDRQKVWRKNQKSPQKLPKLLFQKIVPWEIMFNFDSFIFGINEFRDRIWKLATSDSPKIKSHPRDLAVFLNPQKPFWFLVNILLVS